LRRIRWKRAVVSGIAVAIGAGHPAAEAAALAFECAALHATIPVRCCLLRQARGVRERTKQTTSRSSVGRRCQGTSFPSCDGCRQGAALAARFGALTWCGGGPGGRFERSGHLATQWAARRRLQRVGLLEPVRSLYDGPA
jgi:hypothetical protein